MACYNSCIYYDMGVVDQILPLPWIFMTKYEMSTWKKKKKGQTDRIANGIHLIKVTILNSYLHAQRLT